MGSGTDVAIEAADVTLMRATCAAWSTALDLSRRTIRVIKENLVWAFGYNLILVPVAAGVLYPVAGILLSPGARRRSPWRCRRCRSSSTASGCKRLGRSPHR